MFIQQRYCVRHYVAFDSALCDALQHNLPSFVPAPHGDAMVYPMPSVVFRLFDYTDCPDDGPQLPGAHSIERFLIEQDLNLIIAQNHWERKDWFDASPLKRFFNYIFDVAATYFIF